MANSYSDFSLSFSHVVNPKVESGSHYEHQDILSLEGFELANKEITSWDNYKPTLFIPLMIWQVRLASHQSFIRMKTPLHSEEF